MSDTEGPSSDPETLPIEAAPPARKPSRRNDAMARWLAPTSETRVERIAIDHIVDRDWLVTDDTESASFGALRASIALWGILEPALLRPRADGQFQIVSGQRRLRAARQLGLETLPAVVRELEDHEALSVAVWSTAERLQLTAIEAARLRDRLSAAGWITDELTALREMDSEATTGITTYSSPRLLVDALEHRDWRRLSPMADFSPLPRDSAALWPPAEAIPVALLALRGDQPD